MKKRLFPILMGILMVFAMMPMTAGTVYASESEDPVVGLTGVLETGANTNNAQTVYYGVNGGTPIVWRVIKYKTTGNAYIEDQDDAMTLFSADNLTSGVQFAANGSNYYEGSNLKRVVDGLYGSLFSTKEKSAIKSRTLGVNGYTDQEPYSTGVSGTKTSGYLWPLSTAEAVTLPSNFRSASGFWWLRSPGANDDYTAIVTGGGYVHNYGYNVIDTYGVRPAFNVNLSSVLFTSAAEGGKSSGAAGAGALKPISANSAGKWKLTVYDSSRDVFKASAATGAALSAEEGYTSWSIPIVYKDEGDDPYSITPVPTDKDYVSVILADSQDNALYYGNIDRAKIAGTKNVSIPTGLAAGKYKLHVFYEEINGDYLTDYSSAFRTINLTVTEPPVETYTVTFKAAGGIWIDGTTADKEVTVEKGQAATPPDNPTKEGFTFDGWDTDFSSVTSNLTVTAKWKENTQPPAATEIAIPTGKTLTYNGKSQTGVAAGTGYALSGTTAATNAGTYQATATLNEGYVWSDGTIAAKTISWKINAKAITPTVTLSASAYTYNGKVQKPTVTVKDGSTKLAASQYDVTYASGRKNVGTYKVTVKMKGNYSGSKAVSFKINPKGTTLSKVTKAKKAATAKWKKQAAKMSKSRITGYQIQIATNSKFTKGKKTVNVKGYSKTSKKVTGLKGGKKYYVRIRTYKEVGSATYYSPWSKAKTVTTGK